MQLDSLRADWALWIALFLCVIATLRLLAARYANSARGRLAVEVKRLAAARRSKAAAVRTADAAERRLAKLRRRESATKPRALEDAKLALADAEQLLAGARDQCMIAATRVGQIISEEFPPTQQAALRVRHGLDEDFSGQAK